MLRAYHMAYCREQPTAGEAGEAPAAGHQAQGEALACGAAPVAGGQSSAAAAQAPEVPSRITFLYKLTEGQADESFGLNVAQARGCAFFHIFKGNRTYHRCLHNFKVDCRNAGLARLQTGETGARG